MSHGMRARFRTTSRLRRLGATGATLSLLALLAGCGGQQAQQTTGKGGVVTHSGHYNRPSSYAPPGPAHDPWGPWIRDASRRFDVPERWIREVMRQESGGRVSATSPVGAMGLMQVMPGTYAELRGRYGLGDDPYHPYDSIMAGTAYIREMYELYGSPAFLAAYNAGPRRLEDYLWSSRGLPGETRNYVARIGPNIMGTPPEPPRRARDLRRRRDPALHPGRPAPHGHRDHAGAPRAARRRSSPASRWRSSRPARLSEWTRSPTAPPTPPSPPRRRRRSNSQPLEAAPPAAAGPIVRMDPIPDGSTYPDSAPPPARHAAPEPRLAPTTARTAAVLANVNAPPPQQSSGGGAAASG